MLHLDLNDRMQRFGPGNQYPKESATNDADVTRLALVAGSPAATGSCCCQFDREVFDWPTFPRPRTNPYRRGGISVVRVSTRRAADATRGAAARRAHDAAPGGDAVSTAPFMEMARRQPKALAFAEPLVIVGNVPHFAKQTFSFPYAITALNVPWTTVPNAALAPVTVQAVTGFPCS
ncbi:hypothetical protein ACFRMQ_09820 [Kitasatospora sp. NPDC056783]|uniref:hypothetical protein n=1 Tax=Kitasatospora sp. NPDC056783 TaxID=3345943 RepID=UPI0036A89742